jgi:hypothetical protein
VVVTPGETTRDPDVRDGEKPFPVPLQEIALALLQISIVDSECHIEIVDAERLTVGAAALAWAVSRAPICPETNSGQASKPTLINVNTARGSMRRYS